MLATVLLSAAIAFSTTITAAAQEAAQEVVVGELVIEEPWARATPAGARVGAGYMVIRNAGEAADRLVAGNATFAGRVEIHEMAVQDGVMRMRELDGGLEVPAGGSVVLEPGGYHIMFMQLDEPLVEGDRRAIVLDFENAGEVELTFKVRSMGAGAKHGRAD